MKKQGKNTWWVLVIICVVAAVALAIVNGVTEGPIKDRAMQQYSEALSALFPEAGKDGQNYQALTLEEGSDLDFAYQVLQNGQPIGHAGKATAQGYGGPIEVIFGLSPDGTLRGINVGGSDFKETEGLGSKTKDAAFTDQFQGKTPPLELKQDVDAVAGATVSSSAVVKAVNKGADALRALIGENSGAAAPQSPPAATPQASQAPAPGSVSGRSANASKMGYGGPVLVNLSLDENGKIATLDVGGPTFNETEGLGAKVRESDFVAQFIGKTPPISMTDIDAISGATISTTAVVEAVNAAAEFILGN